MQLSIMNTATIFNSFQLLLIFTCMLLINAAIVTQGARYHHESTFNYLSSTNISNQNHHWIGPIGHRVITVDVNGGGQFRSVQEAVNAVPDNNRMNVLIQISAGYYMYELKLVIWFLILIIN